MDTPSEEVRQLLVTIRSDQVSQGDLVACANREGVLREVRTRLREWTTEQQALGNVSTHKKERVALRDSSGGDTIHYLLESPYGNDGRSSIFWRFVKHARNDDLVRRHLMLVRTNHKQGILMTAYGRDRLVELAATPEMCLKVTFLEPSSRPATANIAVWRMYEFLGQRFDDRTQLPLPRTRDDEGNDVPDEALEAQYGEMCAAADAAATVQTDNFKTLATPTRVPSWSNGMCLLATEMPVYYTFPMVRVLRELVDGVTLLPGTHLRDGVLHLDPPLLCGSPYEQRHLLYTVAMQGLVYLPGDHGPIVRGYAFYASEEATYHQDADARYTLDIRCSEGGEAVRMHVAGQPEAAVLPAGRGAMLVHLSPLWTRTTHAGGGKVLILRLLYAPA